MPVMTRIITADSGSTLNARAMFRSPEAIHVYRVWSIVLASGGRPASCRTLMTDTANDASITSDARPPETLFGSRRPIVALTTKPRNGKRGISASISPFQ
jgi:hypothetical protein